jgi:hypothetical protein
MITYFKHDLKALFNIGDFVCTPDNYFDIQSEKNYRIIGGGVWNIEKYGTDINAQNTILWAAGKSIKEFNKLRPINFSAFKYAMWSIRDRDLISDHSKFVPCVSCLDDQIISEPINDKTLVFTNANETVSPNIQNLKLTNSIIIKNNESYESFISKWKQCDKIITNSYHGIYWSLLSGRAVSPHGYSSKFTSVMRLFDMELPKQNIYNHRAQEAFVEMLKRDQKFITFNKHKEIKQQFANRNYEYAEKLSKIGVICKAKTM